MTKIIFVNGPPGSGKDTLSEQLTHHYRNIGFDAITMKFATSLKLSTHALYGFVDLMYNDYNNIVSTPYVQVYGPDWFLGSLNKPCPEFFRQTPNMVYSNFSKIFSRDLTPKFIVAIHAIHGLFSLKPIKYIPDSSNLLKKYVNILRADFFENSKNDLLYLFDYMSPRNAYIEVSENRIKPHFNKVFFGKVLVNTIKTLDITNPIIFISDSGFTEEAVPVIAEYGEENCCLVNIDATDRGKTFKNDSRSYISLPVPSYTIENNVEGSTNEFVRKAIHLLDPHIRDY